MWWVRRSGIRLVLVTVLFATTLCVAIQGTGLAQITPASVAGSVRDAQGGAIPGATVTLTSEKR